jgi:hypothetical protein
VIVFGSEQACATQKVKQKEIQKGTTHRKERRKTEENTYHVAERGGDGESRRDGSQLVVH